MNAITHSDARGASPVILRYWRLALLIAAVIALNVGGGWLVAQLNFQIWPRHNDMIELLILVLIVAYVFTMMLPFVPGIEIGLALMLFLGPGGIVFVYLCTQVALALSFFIGRLVPRSALQSFLHSLGCERASRLLDLNNGAILQQRCQEIGGNKTGFLALLLRNRYLALAVLLNMPGNAMIGGAGGIGAVSGASGFYAFPRYMAAVSLATTPVPAFLLLTGTT